MEKNHLRFSTFFSNNIHTNLRNSALFNINNRTKFGFGNFPFFLHPPEPHIDRIQYPNIDQVFKLDVIYQKAHACLPSAQVMVAHHKLNEYSMSNHYLDFL